MQTNPLMFTEPSLRRIITAASFILLATASRAEQAAAPPQNPLATAVEIRSARVEVMRDEIKQADERIESRLDAIMQTLTSISDSKDSRTRVARMKEDTMKRLYNTMSYYDRKRAAMKEELRNPRLQLTVEEKQKVIAEFDARIEKRAQQIFALYKSMPTHKDYDRYTTVDYGWYTSDQANSDYDQDRRMTTKTNSQRKALLDSLDQSISRLDTQNRTLRGQFSAATDPARKKMLGDEIAKNEALIAERRKQRLDVLASSKTPTHTIALKEAMDMDKALQTAIKDLKTDFDGMFYYYNNLIIELSALHTAEAALASQTR